MQQKRRSWRSTKKRVGYSNDSHNQTALVLFVQTHHRNAKQLSQAQFEKKMEPMTQFIAKKNKTPPQNWPGWQNQNTASRLVWLVKPKPRLKIGLVGSLTPRWGKKQYRENKHTHDLPFRFGLRLLEVHEDGELLVGVNLPVRPCVVVPPGLAANERVLAGALELSLVAADFHLHRLMERDQKGAGGGDSTYTMGANRSGAPQRWRCPS